MSDWKSRSKVVDAPAEGGWKARSKVVADPGSPLEQALATQKGDVVTVETPTGPAQFTRAGDPFYSPAEAEKIGAGGGARFKERALETALSFLSGGGPMVDELAGASKALAPNVRGSQLLDTYRRGRDEARGDVARATRNASPNVSIAGHQVPVLPLAGAVSTSLLAPNPATVLGRIGLSGVMGAEQAAGDSEADLTQGDVGGFLKDTGRGAGTGLAAGGVAEGLAVPARAIARGAASRIGDAVATRAATDTADVAADIASMRGQLGGESQKMSRMFENTQRASSGGVPPAGVSPIDPALQQRAMLALSEPGTARLQEKVIERTLGEMPGQVGTVTRLEQELAQRSAGAGAEAAQRTSNFFAQPTIRTDVLPRVGRQLQNAAIGTAAALPAAVGFGASGGKAGAIGALLAGAGTGLAKGALNSARTTMANPRLQVGALETVVRGAQTGQRVLQGQARAASASAPLLQNNDEQASAKQADDEAAIQAFLTGG